MNQPLYILVVEDEKMALEEIVDIIKEILPDASVSPFTNGLKALEHAQTHPVDIAFLDIEMREIRGLDLARKLIDLYPSINIIFATGYDQYTKEALDMHVSGYILKPTTFEKVEHELKDLRHPVSQRPDKRIRIVTFGSFDVFIDNLPVHFKYSKTRELLAYLVDKNGALCGISDIMMSLWGDMNHTSYFKNIRGDLYARFKEKGVEDALIKQRGQIAVIPEKIDCDYFDLIREGKEDELSRLDYMTSYEWGRFS